MAKLNGNITWVIMLALVSLGWVYTLGDRSHSLKSIEKELDKKADLAYVEQVIKRLDEKMDLILTYMSDKD